MRLIWNSCSQVSRKRQHNSRITRRVASKTLSSHQQLTKNLIWNCSYLGRFPASCRGCIQQVFAFRGLSLADDTHRATREWESPGKNAFPGLPVAGRRSMTSSMLFLWWSFTATQISAAISPAVLQKRAAALLSPHAVVQRPHCCTAKLHVTDVMYDFAMQQCVVVFCSKFLESLALTELGRETQSSAM